MMRFKDSSEGFTLIELLVSIGILLFLTGFTISNYSKFNDAQIVRQAVDTLKSNLRSIKISSSSGIKPASGCEELVGYQVTFSATSYTTTAICSNGGVQQSVGTPQQFNLPGTVSFNPLPSPILFNVLDRGIATTSAITISGSQTTLSFQVFSSGVMVDLPVTPTPSPTP